MSKKRNSNKSKSEQIEQGITRLSVCGFKSISREQSIEVRPLTILAGANSSGKSSIMQPLLLLKQTLESSYDPGALLLDGPNVKFTSADQVLSRIGKKECEDTFNIGIGVEPDSTLTTYFKKQLGKGFEVEQTVFARNNEQVILRPGMTHKEIMSVIPFNHKGSYGVFNKDARSKPTWKVKRDRFFLSPVLTWKEDNLALSAFAGVKPRLEIEPHIRSLVYLPALRGNPERAYPVTAVGPIFPGTFQEYTASIIAQWQAEKSEEKLSKLSKDLERLGLTWKIVAKPINDTQVELQVGRLPHGSRGGAHDLVSITDVGFGVSQTLPVLVALIAAEPGQLVYIEEPETHLHPRAQSAMAQILADAANRGVQVVIETHSNLLLLGIQTLVAENNISPDLVKLHWFERNNDGSTQINSADLNEAGAFGNWPEDFGEVILSAESRYLDAAEAQQIIN